MSLVASALSLLFSALITGCEGDQKPLLAEYNAPPDKPLALRETFEQLRADYARRAYAAMRPYIVPEQREATIEVLQAVDELLSANAAVLKAVGRASPETPAQALDISGPVLENLEIFSRTVRVLGEQENGQEGIVRIEIAGASPEVNVHFRRQNDHWAYVPGPDLAKAVQGFQDLTKAMNRIALSIMNGGHLTPEQVAYEYKLRVQPKLQQFRTTAPAG